MELQEQKSVKNEFLKPLPNEHLFKFPEHRRFDYSDRPKDWFSFLAMTDDESGRAGKRAEEFPYIQYDQLDFLSLIKKHIKPRHKSFIDVGCGAGDKLDIVKQFRPDLHVVGVEHDPAMATWAKLVGDEVFCADAFSLSYEPYDIIYAYWPISNRDLMMKLCRHIIRTKKRSAKFLLVGFTPSVTRDKEFLTRHTTGALLR